MPEPKLEEVFKVSGIPTYTFVQPMEFSQLLVALRSPGRGVVIEGPSGIGKTTAVEKALDELGKAEDVLKLSARKRDERELIEGLPEMGNIGTVLIDDFHRLDEGVRQRVADYLKTLADEEKDDSKVVIIGINRAGESLVQFARDLVNRIDVIRFEANPTERVEELITQGEKALNLQLGNRADIITSAGGSFYIAQMLARETCMAAGILDAQAQAEETSVSYEVVLTRVMDRLNASFLKVAVSFASGTKLRREGRPVSAHAQMVGQWKRVVD
jgi:DNA helicase TIP49 (TBP-interacting protein)